MCVTPPAAIVVGEQMYEWMEGDLFFWTFNLILHFCPHGSKTPGLLSLLRWDLGIWIIVRKIKNGLTKMVPEQYKQSEINTSIQPLQYKDKYLNTPINFKYLTNMLIIINFFTQFYIAIRYKIDDISLIEEPWNRYWLLYMSSWVYNNSVYDYK